MLECVPNVSAGRDPDVVAALSEACGDALLDRHVDGDHHRTVFTLAGPGDRDALGAALALARAVAEHCDLRGHAGVHPRLGALDVVPFVALDEPFTVAVDAAREFATRVHRDLGVPVFGYDGAAPDGAGLPDIRRDAFVRRAPDLGGPDPHPRLGAVAVGARAPLVAVNCWLASADLPLARRVARAVRARDGGLPGVRALGLALAGPQRAQVSMNLVDLDRTGIEAACTAVRDAVEAAGDRVERVELVGLVRAADLDRCGGAFLAWAGLGPEQTIEARLAGRRP